MKVLGQIALNEQIGGDVVGHDVDAAQASGLDYRKADLVLMPSLPIPILSHEPDHLPPEGLPATGTETADSILRLNGFGKDRAGDLNQARRQPHHGKPPILKVFQSDKLGIVDDNRTLLFGVTTDRQRFNMVALDNS
ncbi:hypothetical protein [Mesorhizobium sp.]|uniref:hypothetical protein n=1 Tax=Mesorhizobium sp. TaxID=1871066 RepID=UPI0025F30772|nr:hypothetical protein [Mesorhizobium sp.]